LLNNIELIEIKSLNKSLWLRGLLCKKETTSGCSEALALEAIKVPTSQL
jgi:hypothetical protein